MPLEISVEPDKENKYYDTHAYTVYVGEHRILTFLTDCNTFTAKWFKDVHKTSRPNNHKHGCLLVGVSADRNLDDVYYDIHLGRQPDPAKAPYHVLQVCVGSHCFIYRLPNPSEDSIPKAVQAFFADPKVVAVGMNMSSVAKKLEADHGIKFANPVDLNELAVKGMKRDELDLGRYDINRLAMAVLGKQWDVVRPDGPVIWFRKWRTGYYWNEELSVEKVEQFTVDAFRCFMIGTELLDMMDEKWYPKDFKKFLRKKKKYRKKF